MSSPATLYTIEQELLVKAKKSLEVSVSGLLCSCFFFFFPSFSFFFSLSFVVWTVNGLCEQSSLAARTDMADSLLQCMCMRTRPVDL